MSSHYALTILVDMKQISFTQIHFYPQNKDSGKHII